MADGSPVLVATLRFVVFALLAVVGPGVAVQRLLRLPVDKALVLPLGYAFAAAAGGLSLATGQAWLFPSLALAMVAALFVRGPWQAAPGPSLRGVLPSLAAVGVLFALTQYPMNRRLASGDFALDALERVDTTFHVAVVWELVNYPPQVPGLAGFPLGYHVGPHLVRAMALRWAGIHPYDALSRFDLTLQTLALLLALRAAAHALGGGSLAVKLAPFTVLLGDLAFVFAGQPAARWWTELLGGNLLLSLDFGNSLVPALAMALGATIAAARSASGGPAGWLLAAAILGLALPFFKVFLAAQLAACAVLAAVLLRRRGAPGAALLAFALPSIAGVLWLASSPAARAVQVLLDPLAPVARLRALLGMAPAEGLALLGWGALWLALALGIRILAVPEAARAAGEARAAPLTLALVALLGWPVAMLVRVTADQEFNEAVYFTNASGALLWLFGALALERHVASRRSRLAPAVLAAAALSLPTTVEFTWRKLATRPDVVPARVFEAMERLVEDSGPGDVVLMRPYSRYPPPPIVFAGRRVAYTLYWGYLRQFLPAAEVYARSARVRGFFRAASPDEARAIAGSLGARHVFLQGSQAMGNGARAILEPVYVRRDTALYRVR
ncbi:MAG TPA: hypothetical protein VFM88_22445 [Vicinamibacteria bacterium]|nr:hypothetical protein [Vicinamibacteria bacterium]